MTTRERGASISNGQSIANGPDAPFWMRAWEMRELLDSRTDIWKMMELWSTACTALGQMIPGTMTRRSRRQKPRARSTRTRRTSLSQALAGSAGPGYGA